MNCNAITNKPLELNIIKDSYREINDSINLIATYTNSKEAVDEIRKNETDVIFLDVNMPNVTDFEFIKSLSKPPLIIFTSEFSKHIMTSFKMHSSNPLPNLIPFDKFAKVVNKDFTSRQNRDNNPGCLDNSPSHKPAEYFFVKVDYSLVKVCTNEIKYIEGYKDYIKIYVNDKSLITKSTIKNMESKLPRELFVRVHRSYIISLDKIDKIENNQVFIGLKKIPIGMQYKDSFYERIGCFRL